MTPNEGEGDVGIEACGDGDRVGGVVAVIVVCSSGADEVECAIDIAL